jgi:hypothetical protein
MKRLLFLPLLAMPLLVLSCDGQLPVAPETAGNDQEPSFARAAPALVLPLYKALDAGSCFGPSFDTSDSEEYGRVSIRQRGDQLKIRIALREGLPEQEYGVTVMQTRQSALSCSASGYSEEQFLFTNPRGKGQGVVQPQPSTNPDVYVYIWAGCDPNDDCLDPPYAPLDLLTTEMVAKMP